MTPILFVGFMTVITRYSCGEEGVSFGSFSGPSLFFADYTVGLVPTNHGLQHALEKFTDKCEALGVRDSSSKAEDIVLNQKMVKCFFLLGMSVCLKQRSLSIFVSYSPVMVKLIKK